MARGKTQVVAAAIVRDGRLLACRRTWPTAEAGRWELPGGKVEPGESPEAALVREIDEELGVSIEVTRWLDGSTPISRTHELTVALATVAAWHPRPVDHDRLRWVRAARLDDLDWLEPDRPFLTQLRGTLAP